MKVDVRLVTATNKSLKSLLASGAMREDFYYRIRVFEITIPPLRERREDLPVLVNHFITEGAKAHQHPVKDIAKDAMQHLMNHYWPGNVRELKNAIDHAFVTVAGECITLLDLPPEIRWTVNQASETKGTKKLSSDQEAERTQILEALQQANRSKTAAAKLLGFSRVTLWKKLHKLGISSQIPKTL